MYNSVYDFKSFYNSRSGRLIRRVLSRRIREFWPETKDLRILGCGYAVPYLRMFGEDAERIFAAMPAALGAHHWPEDGGGLTCLSEEAELPFETNSIDRILLIHNLEYAELLQPNLGELWRVLKSNGRLLVIVPNRLGFWARADWSPFGNGTPFSASQIRYYMRENLFVHERTEEALFVPPIRWPLVFRFAGMHEAIGRRLYPALGGVHMIEASKQLYAGTKIKEGSKVRIRGREIFIPKPVPVPRGDLL